MKDRKLSLKLMLGHSSISIKLTLLVFFLVHAKPDFVFGC